MNKSYKGYRKPYVLCLSADADRENVLPVIEAIQKNKTAADYGHLPKSSEMERALAVIAFLSENFYADGRLKQALLDAVNKGLEIIPVYMDGTETPRALSLALYSVNGILSARYSSPEELATRILSSETLKNPKITRRQKEQFRRLCLMGAFAALVILAAAVAVTAWAASAKKEFMLSYGISEEELASMEYLYLIGDTRVTPEVFDDGQYQDWGTFVFDIWDDDNNDIFYFAESGEAVPMGNVTDLSILKKMPNLKALILINQPITDMPDLSGLKQLERVVICNCDISDLSFLEGSAVTSLELRCLPAEDLSHISEMENLENFKIMAFAGSSLNFSAPQLTELYLANSPRLRDISGLSGMTSLTNLYMNANGLLWDISALKDIDTLEEVYIGCSPIENLSALANKPNIRRLELHDLYFKNVDFLRELGTTQIEKLNLYSNNTWGEAVDFSGLESMEYIGELSFSANGYDYSCIAPYVTNISICEYDIGHTRNIDFSLLPKDIEVLGLWGYRESDLSALPEGMKLSGFKLVDSQFLSSLDGIEHIEGLKELKLSELERMQDFDALYELGEDLETVEFCRIGSMPDLRKVPLAENCELSILEPLTDYEDLSAIAELTTAEGTPVKELENLVINGVSDIRGLYSLADKDIKIKSLGVDSLLYSTARDYQTAVQENFGYDTQVYFHLEDNDNYIPNDFRLYSYEEIDTLPEAALKAVTEAYFIGNLYEDSGTLERLEWSDDDGNYTYIRVDETLDMQVLSKLENLERLEICNLEIENFEYIQTLQNLREIRMTDVKTENLGILDIMAGIEYKEINNCEEAE